MKNIYQAYKKSISFCWKSVVSTSHTFFILRLVLCLFGAVLPILGTKLSALLIDTITYTVAFKADFINEIKPFLVLLIGILLINVFNRSVDTLILFFTTLHKDLMQNSLKKTISRRASEIDLSYFDCAEFYDQLQDINANTPYIADLKLRTRGEYNETDFDGFSVGACFLYDFIGLPNRGHSRRLDERVVARCRRRA